MLRSRYQSWLLPYLEGSLDPEKKVLLEAQLARDSALMAEAEQLRHTVMALRTSAADQEPLATTGFSVWPGVQARIQNQPQRSFGRVWAWSGIGVAAAAAGILIVTLLSHPSETLIPPTSKVAKIPAPASPATMQASRETDNKAMPVPFVTKPTVSPAKPKIASKTGPTQSISAPSAGPNVGVAPILPIPTAGKGGARDPFGLPPQKSHQTMMAQVPKGEFYSSNATAGSVAPMSVTVTFPSAKGRTESFASQSRRDKDAVVPSAAQPREFGDDKSATHKDIVPGGGGTARGGFGGGASAPKSPETTPIINGAVADGNLKNSDSATVPSLPNKIVIPIPAAAPAPVTSAGVRLATPPPAATDILTPTNQAASSEIMSKTHQYNDMPANNAAAMAFQMSEMQLKSTVNEGMYGSADTEKRTAQLFESLRSAGTIGNLRRNLLQERKLHPEDLEVSRLVAALYTFLSDKDAALAERRRIVALHGATGEDWYQLAVAAQHKSDIATARNAYFQVLQIGGLNNPDHSEQARQFFMQPSGH